MIDVAEGELDAEEANLALARGRLLHARLLATGEEDPRELPLFEQAAERYRQLGDTRGEADALFWMGCYHQVVRDDDETGRPSLERSYELATKAGDKLIMSYAVRHLGFSDQAAGDTEAARARLEESVRLRRDIGFLPGVAAGLLALAQLSTPDDATLLAEAEAVARECGAHGVLRRIADLRT